MKRTAISIKDGNGTTRHFTLQYITALYPDARNATGFCLDTISAGGDNGFAFYYESPEAMLKEFHRVQEAFSVFHGISAGEETP